MRTLHDDVIIYVYNPLVEDVEQREVKPHKVEL